MNKKIILLSGAPNSINSEIIYKCWQKLSDDLKHRVFVISNYNLLNAQFKLLRYKIKTSKVKNIFHSELNKELKIIDIDLKFKDPFKVSKKSASKFISKSLTLAHHFGMNTDVAGIINCPIDKNLLQKRKIGVTEILASKCNVKNDGEVMVIKNKNLMVAPITTHIDIKSISKKLNKKIIIKKISIINNWFKKKNNAKPKIGVLGLNPHNAELNKFSEEKKFIIPAIKKLKKLGLKVSGPLVADTVFINEYKNYDVIVGMYHDQVLSPFKTLFKFDAINLTLGLKYIRVSPDHGIATDNILLKKSTPISLLRCIEYINEFCK